MPSVKQFSVDFCVPRSGFPCRVARCNASLRRGCGRMRACTRIRPRPAERWRSPCRHPFPWSRAAPTQPPNRLTAHHWSCAMAPGIGAAAEEAASVALARPQDHLAAAVGAARRVIFADSRMTLPQVGDMGLPTTRRCAGSFDVGGSGNGSCSDRSTATTGRSSRRRKSSPNSSSSR